MSTGQAQRAATLIESTNGYASEVGEEVREEFHQTYPLAANGRISLENLNGACAGKSLGPAAVQVDAVKARIQERASAEAKIEVSSTDENIRIKTEYPDWTNTSPAMKRAATKIPPRRLQPDRAAQSHARVDRTH